MSRVLRTSSMLVTVCLMLTGLLNHSVAQEFRATVNGRVTDASGAAVPGVTITARNPQTNETATATSNEEGNYAIPFLKPGTYLITAEASGFKKTTQEQLLEVSQTATINLQLQVGDVTEVVTVTSDTALLDESKADRGLVIDNTRVTELPLNARNPFMLSTLAPGITYNGPAIYQRPFDNGAIADWSINGGQNRNNEFLMDGAPNNSIAGGNNIAYVPPVDAVQEFKIITNGYDAQYGRSAGGTVNVTTKSGGNDFHGTVYEFARRKFLDANLFLNNAQKRERSDHLLDQYGFVINGPVYLPRFGEGGPSFYSGKDKSFFNFSYEGYREKSPLSATLTYPDAAQRLGDFSNLRNANGDLIVIYEPNSSATGAGRTPISCNGRINVICPERLNPIARRILDFYPQPNATPSAGTDRFRNNYFAPIVAADDFKNYLFRFDQNFGQNDKMFFRYAYNKRIETRTFNGILGNPAEDSQGPLERINYTGVVDYVKTISPTVILNLRASANRYIEAARTEAALNYDISQLGFPASYASDIPIQFFPRFNFSDYTNLGRGGFSRGITNVFSFQPNMTVIHGNHTTRFGLDYRFSQLVAQNSGRAAGEFNFNRNATRRNFNNDDTLTAAQIAVIRNNFGVTGGIASNVSGNSIASFLLGATGNTFVENVPFPTYGQHYAAPWFQDDWKISQRLTLNFGLRWDFNGPYKERFNRANFGFDPTVVNPVSSRVPGSPQLRGGLLFAGANDNPEGVYKWDYNNIQPRAGFAYQLNEQTVLRGGYGLYYLNPTDTGRRFGFDVTTPSINSLDDGRTSLLNFSNPFPAGINDPLGAAGGLFTYLGRNPDFFNTDFKVPYVHQFSLGFQRQLPFRTVLEVSYVGSRTRNEQTPGPGGTQGPNPGFGFNEPDAAFRARCDVTQGGSPTFCNEQLTNPFLGVPGFENTTFFTAPTLSRYQLNRPFPQFTGFTQLGRNDGRIWYDSLQVSANKRMTRGFTIQGTYTFSKMIEQNDYIDSIARRLSKHPYFSDRPHRITASSVWELPIGRGRYFLGDAPKVVDMIFGGIEFAGTFIFQSGKPWEIPDNVEYVRDASNPDPEQFRGLNNQFDPANYILGVAPCVAQRSSTGQVSLIPNSVALGCTEPNFIIRSQFEERKTALHFSSLRRPSYTQFDMNFAKSIRFSESMRLQLRAEVFNVTNTPQYDERNYIRDPNNAGFGRINKTIERQSNFPRQIQLAAKFIF